MSTRRKVVLGALIAVFILLTALVIAVPLLVDIDRYRPQVTAHIRQQTGKAAEIGHLALTIFPKVSIRVDDFSLENPPGFPQGYFVQTRRIYAVVDAWALWDRQILIKSLELDDPAINLLSDVRGKWNFENAPALQGAADPPPGEKPMFTLGVISMVSINGGRLTAANLLASGRPGPTFFEAHGVSSRLEQVDLNAFAESASMRLAPGPAGSPAAPETLWSASLAYAAAPQPQPAAQGTLKAESLRFGTLGVSSVKSKIRLFPKQVFFDDLAFDCYGGRATGSFSFNFAGQNPRYSTNARLRGVNVTKLLAAFPDARGKMTGTLEGNMQLAGEVTHSPDPLAGMQGTGLLSARNGQIPSLQLNKNLMKLARLANLGPAEGDPSSFSSISADLNIANQRIASKKVVIIGNGVDIDGSGSLAVAGEGNLDYEGIARIAAEKNALTEVLAGLSGAKLEGGKLTFPFALGGTFQNPKFTLKSAGGAGRLGAVGNILGAKPGQAQQPADLVQGISGLFKKKKPQPK
jgi:uncharacterized protein involved in outer membrane biogenesis